METSRTPINNNGIKFGLQTGMNDKQLWSELHKVGISGETTEEVQVFKEPYLYHQNVENIPLHNVIMSNEKYAIIGKSYVYEDQFRGMHEEWTYYLCGINDEHKYFIRPITGFESKYNHATIQEVVDWCNREDEGFLKRVQGDVLIKYISMKSIQGNKDHLGSMYLKNVIDDGKTYFFMQVNSNPINLGNHKLFCDGSVYTCSELPILILRGESFMLKHREHEFVNEEIPQDKLAVLAPQRGRTFDLSQYLRRAFD
jgi:hypothetical protein